MKLLFERNNALVRKCSFKNSTILHSRVHFCTLLCTIRAATKDAAVYRPRIPKAISNRTPGALPASDRGSVRFLDLDARGGGTPIGGLQIRV